MIACLMLLMVFPADPMPEAVELKTPTGTIYGGFDIPEGKGPWPLVIVHAGSGPTDRDGNNPQMKNNSLKMLGEGLRANGFAVLRFDKRGIAASAKSLGKMEDLRIEHYANDVVEWAKLIRADKRFSHIAFIGHSEGSVIGTSAAKEAKFDAYVSLCGPGRGFDVLVVEQVSKDSEELGKKSGEIMAAIAKGEEPKDVPAVLQGLFNKPTRPYVRSMLAHDPAKEFGELTCPALIVSGTTDIQVAEADYKALAAANPKAKAVRIERMNHILKEFEKTNKLLQIGSYMDPKLPLHPNLIETISPFLKDSLTAK
jgi:uncharacterized protein